jgi:lysophospholipase L1-like esterase
MRLEEQAEAIAAPGPEERPGGAVEPPRRTWRLKLASVAISMLLTFLVLELVFRLLGYQPIYQVYSKPEAFWRKDPQLGWSLQPDSSGEFVGPRPFPIAFRAHVQINSMGIRGPEVTPVPQGGFRVLLVGDSQAAGFEVRQGQTYAALLQQKLTQRLRVPVQVVDAAVRGYGTDQVLLQYRERLRGLHPDLVIYHTTSNDPDDNVTLHRMRRIFSKPAFSLGPDASLKLVNYPVHEYPQCSEYRLNATFHPVRIDSLRARAFCRLQTGLTDHSAFFSFVTSRIERNPRLVKLLYGLGSPSEGESPPPQPAVTTPSAPAGPTPPPAASQAARASTPASSLPTSTTQTAPAPASAAPSLAGLDYEHKLTSVLIGQLATDVTSDGARFVVIGEHSDIASLALGMLQATDSPVIQIDGALGHDPNAVRFANDGHLNVTGHRRVADFLAPWIAGLLEQR